MADKRACRSCGAQVQWVRTEGGKAMPIDLEPVTDGNIVPIDLDGQRVAHVLTAEESADYDGPRFVSHFATCPNAAQHRRR